MRLQQRALVIGVVGALSAFTTVALGVAAGWPSAIIVALIGAIAVAGAITTHRLVRCPYCRRRAGFRGGPGIHCRYCSRPY